MKKYVWLTVFCVIVVSIIGCGRIKGKKDDKGAVLAKIGNEAITLGEFEDRIEKLPENIRVIAQRNKPAYLDNLVVESLMHKEALKRRLDKDREVQELFKEAKKRIIIARLAREEVEDKIKLGEEELKDYYQEHQNEFIRPELYRASHILVDDLDKAVEIIDRLNAGALFEEMAKKHSKDVTNKRGGDIGYFSVGQMVPEFEDACLKLKVEELSGPVKTQFGYHIIKLTDKREPELLDFDKARENIEMMVKNAKRRDLFQDLITRLKAKTKITVNSGLLLEPQEESLEERLELPPSENLLLEE